MCTVTYLPLGNSDFILTSSRDVPYAREKAAHPQKYNEQEIDLWYPKDGKAGGTWIGISAKNRLICLLNGGFEYHTSLSRYEKSRGLIVKELLKVDSIKEGLETINLKGVEQFTLTIVDWNESLELLEFVWDGYEKHLKVMPQTPAIWSSSTLYDKMIKQMRNDWFSDWQKDHNFTKEAILEFHHTAGVGDPRIDVLMDRKLGGTVSITAIKKIANTIEMDYEDIFTKKSNKLLISKK